MPARLAIVLPQLSAHYPVGVVDFRRIPLPGFRDGRHVYKSRLYDPSNPGDALAFNKDMDAAIKDPRYQNVYDIAALVVEVEDAAPAPPAGVAEGPVTDLSTALALIPSLFAEAEKTELIQFVNMVRQSKQQPATTTAQAPGTPSTEELLNAPGVELKDEETDNAPAAGTASTEAAAESDADADAGTLDLDTPPAPADQPAVEKPAAKKKASAEPPK